MRSFGDEMPAIDYPCAWTWKVVGRDEERLRAAVAAAATGLRGEYTLTPSRVSRTGKYLSLELVATVHDDEERRGIGQALYDHADVLFVF